MADLKVLPTLDAVLKATKTAVEDGDMQAAFKATCKHLMPMEEFKANWPSEEAVDALVQIAAAFSPDMKNTRMFIQTVIRDHIPSVADSRCIVPKDRLLIKLLECAPEAERPFLLQNIIHYGNWPVINYGTLQHYYSDEELTTEILKHNGRQLCRYYRYNRLNQAYHVFAQEREATDKDEECCVCKVFVANTVVTPCFHMMCKSCTDTIKSTTGKCPQCRMMFESAVPND